MLLLISSQRAVEVCLKCKRKSRFVSFKCEKFQFQQSCECLLLLSCLLMQDSVPFAVIGSNTVVEARGQRVRGRLYPWGIVEGKDRSFPPRSSYRGNAR